MTFMTSHARRSGLLAAVLAAALMALAPGRTCAQESGFESLAGWEGDSFEQGYAYSGLGWLIPLGAHLVAPERLMVSYLYYDFQEDGVTTRVTAPGVSLIAGLRAAAEVGSFTILGGGEVRWEQRETAGAPDENDVLSGGVVEVDGDLELGSRWRAMLLASYAGAAEYAYGRTAVQYQLSNLDWQGPVSFFAGVEAVRQGNYESDAAQGGAYLECSLVRARLSIGLHGGYKESWSPGEPHRTGSYVGVSLYRRF